VAISYPYQEGPGEEPEQIPPALDEENQSEWVPVAEVDEEPTEELPKMTPPTEAERVGTNPTTEGGGTTYTQKPPEPLSANDERTWAMISHLSVLANLVTGFLGPVIPLIIYLVYKDRSRYVAFQSMQAFVFQLIWWVGAGVLAGILWAISGALAVILIGCLLMPVALVVTFIPLAALVYGVIGAVQTSQGQNFRYWLIGDWVADMLRSA
jgi:uncharacterized Tic20 family protein